MATNASFTQTVLGKPGFSVLTTFVWADQPLFSDYFWLDAKRV